MAFLPPKVGKLNKPIFKSSNARGGGGGSRGMLKLHFDWYVKHISLVQFSNPN